MLSKCLSIESGKHFGNVYHHVPLVDFSINFVAVQMPGTGLQDPGTKMTQFPKEVLSCFKEFNFTKFNIGNELLLLCFGAVDIFVVAIGLSDYYCCFTQGRLLSFVMYKRIRTVMCL